jgi:outer membrane protein TolC
MRIETVPMRIIALVFATFCLAGCAVGPDFQQPDVALASKYMSAKAVDTRTADADWWKGFHDPVLVALVDKAISGNTDLTQARAGIDQSRAAALGADAKLLPVVDGTGDATAVRQSLDTPIGAVSRILGLPRDYNEYAVGTQAAWEIDVFGGLRRGREAARDEYLASEADAGAIAVSVAAETADAYLTLRSFQSRLAIAENQEQTERGLVDVVQQRFNEGLAPERELDRAQAELESIRASTAPLRANNPAPIVACCSSPGRSPPRRARQAVLRPEICCADGRISWPPRDVWPRAMHASEWRLPTIIRTSRLPRLSAAPAR